MEKIKILVLAFLVLAAAYLAYSYLGTTDETSLKLGAEVNAGTFSAILANASSVFIVMDVRNVSDPVVRKNIMQCGVDFAGSSGLALKNQTFYSFDSDQGCYTIEGFYPVEYCLRQMESDGGIALYVRQGNSSRFYTNAVMVGMGTNYTSNGCSIKFK